MHMEKNQKTGTKNTAEEIMGRELEADKVLASIMAVGGRMIAAGGDVPEELNGCILVAIDRMKSGRDELHILAAAYVRIYGQEQLYGEEKSCGLKIPDFDELQQMCEDVRTIPTIPDSRRKAQMMKKASCDLLLIVFWLEKLSSKIAK